MIKKIWTFAGSIYFALILILCTAILVIAGTWIESYTDSHSFAGYYTYNSPVFSFLLGGYFVNILVSALRRWPFQKRHVPFLLTHLGLLSLLAGAIIKIYFGKQGALVLVEGSGSSDLLLPASYALLIESPYQKMQIPLQEGVLGNLPQTDLSLRILNWQPHSLESHQTWIKNNQLSLRNLPPLSLNQQFKDLPHQSDWKVLFTSHPTTEDLLPDLAKLKVFNHSTGNLVAEFPLSDLLSTKKTVADYALQATIEPKQLVLILTHLANDLQEQIVLSLDGVLPPLYQQRSELLLPKRFTFVLEAVPTVIFHQQPDHQIALSLINQDGLITQIDLDQEQSLYTYGKGYGGYSVGVNLPYPLSYGWLKEQRQARWEEVKQTLMSHVLPQSTLVPPLKGLLRLAKDDVSIFADLFTRYLEDWHAEGTWLFQGNHFWNEQLAQVDWNTLLAADLNRYRSSAQLFSTLQVAALRGEDVLTPLRNFLGYPDASLAWILNTLENYSEGFSSFLTTPISPSLLLSAALRSYEIFPEKFLEASEAIPHSNQIVSVETDVLSVVSPTKPLVKWEDNRPMMTLEVSDDQTTEIIQLRYDKYCSQLKQPILGGKYLVRFQSLLEKIPYHVRLKQAKQIHYPGTEQPFSYEAETWVRAQNGSAVQASLSMNHVYETWDGYRFYLSNITPGTRDALQQVQIVVNKDPAKYLLTLPGFFILMTGVFLLFFKRPS